MPPLPCMCLTALPNRLPPSLLLKAQSVSWHVCIFHYFQFITKPQRKEQLAVGEGRTGERENRMKGRGKAGEPKISPPQPSPHLHPHPQPHPSHRKRGKNLRTPAWVASTTQPYSYANSAVSVSTVGVLTGGAVLRRPSSLPHHLFKSSKQKPGERATWLVKYACVGPLQWNNDCGITPACARGCVAISCQHWVNVRDVYSWGRSRERERGRIRKRGVIKDGGEVGDTDITPVWAARSCMCWDCGPAETGSAGWKTERGPRVKKKKRFFCMCFK